MNKRRSQHGAALRIGPSGVVVGAEAERLLASLAGEGAYAFPDPLRAEGLIVRAGSSGMSLGGGQFSAKAGEALLAAGLVERDETRRERLRIGPSGRARLRRGQVEGPTGYLAQHLDLVAGTGADKGALRDVSESPLEWMARRRGRDGAPLIDAACYEAGERLRRDLAKAAVPPKLSPDWGLLRVDGSGPRDAASTSDLVIAARQRVDRAMDAVGSDLSGLLIDLCGFLKGLERIEAERGWPARSAKVVARIALARLAEHYGLAREATGPDRARSRLWRA